MNSYELNLISLNTSEKHTELFNNVGIYFHNLEVTAVNWGTWQSRQRKSKEQQKKDKERSARKLGQTICEWEGLATV